MSEETTRAMSNNTLKIRIQIQQPQPQAIEELYPEPEVTYEETLDWNRIAIAAVLLLSLLILLGYLLFADGDTTEKIANETIPANNTAASFEKAILLEKAAPESSAATMTTGVPSGELVNAPESSAKPAESNAANAAVKAVPIPAKKPQRTVTVHQSSNVAKMAPKTAAQAKPQQTADHGEVVRAQLSRAIEAREPVDSIDTVELLPGESKPIYFYSHLKNLRGKNIRIDWYFNDNLDSKLNLQIRNNNWRSHASKQLDHHRLGAWRVELIDESGNQLATRNFTVTQQ